MSSLSFIVKTMLNIWMALKVFSKYVDDHGEENAIFCVYFFKEERGRKAPFSLFDLCL